MSPYSTRSSLYSDRPFVFATRRSTYLKKHGDVFKIHTPGLARGAGRDSISFESVRWPGYYLKHRAEENDFKFRIARSKPSNYRIFNKEATFVVEKHNGIEGSGMLRLFDKPSWYLCVRKHDIADSALKAMKRDSSPDFRLRCSFFIEKLEPAAVVGEVMKTKENHHDEPATKRKHIHRPALAIRKLLDSYVNHGKLELLRDDLGKSFGQTLNTIADNKPQQMHLVNNYLQPSRISALEATRTYGPSVIWSKQSPNNALRSFNSHLHVLGSIPHPSTIKTPIAQLSDKIAQLSFVPRLDSYTFTKAVSGNEYSLYKGRNAFPAARFSRTQQSFNRPAKWHDVKGKSIKKNEISKAYNNTNNTTKTENVSGNNIRLNETKVSILGNLTKENSSVVAFGGNETREIHSDKVVNQNSTRFYHILHGVSNGVVRVKIESSISDSKKVENLMENPNLLSLHSSGTNLNLSNSTLFNNDPKYVRKKTISHGFYQEEPLMEGLIADPKKPEVAFDDDESKGMEVKHLFADSKGHVSPLNINEPNKNPTVHIESSKNVADSEVNKDGDLSANDGNKMGAIHVNEGSKEAALTLSEASKEASINFNGVSKDAGLTIGESSKEPDLKQEGTVVSHVFADSKGHVIPMNRNQDQKSTGAKTNEKQITGEAKETFESAPATGNVNAETKSVNVKHLFANNTGRIEGLKPRHNSYIAKLTSPLTSLKELKKLGKKIKLGAHCKRSVGGAIHVSECDDEDSNTHENEMTDTDIPGHSHFTDHDNSEAGLTDLDLSHFDHKSNAEEDPVDSITTEAADGDKESETDEVYGHKSGSEVDDEHEEGANEDEDEEENEHQSHHGNHHDYDENHHDDAYHHGDHEHEHHHEGDDHDYNDHHNHEHSYHEHDNGEHHFEENHHGDHGEHHYTRHDMGHETEHEGHEEHEDHGEHEEHEDHEDHGEHEGLGEHEDHEEHEDHGEHEENDDHGEHHEDHGDHHDDDSYDDGHMEPGHHWIDQNGEHHVYMGDSWESKSCREGKCSSSSGGSTGGSGGKSNSSTSGGSSSSSSSGGSSNSSTASSEGSSGSSSSAGSGGSTGSSGSTGSGSSSSSGGSTGSTGSTESGGTSGSSGSTGSGGSSGTSSSGGTSGSNSSAGSTSSAGNSMGGVNIGTSVGSGGGTAGAGSAGGITIGGGAGGSSGPTGGIKIDGNGSTGREGSAGGIKVNGGSTAAGGAGGSTGLKIGTDSNGSGGTTGGTKGAGVKIGGGTSGSGNVSPINNQTGGSASSSKGKAINANSTGADSAASAGVDNKNLPQLLNAKLPLGNANIGGGSKNNSANKNAGANNNNAGGLNNIGTNNNKATANNNGGAVNNSGNNNGGLNNGGLNNSENNNGRLNNGRLNNGAANGGTNAGAGNGLTDPNSLNNIFNTNNNLNQNNNNNSSSGGGGGGGATNNNNNITANKSNNANNNANTGNQNNNPFGGGSNNNSNAGGGGFPNTLGGGGGGGLPNPLGINIADAVKQLPNLLGNGLPNLGGIPNPLGGGGGGGLPNPLGGGGGPFGFNKTKGGKKIENGKANNNFNNNKTSSGSIVNNENMKGGAKNNEKTGVKNVENVSKNNKDLKTAHKNAEDTKIDGKNAGETQMNGKKEDDIKVGEKSKENVKLKDESESKVKYVDEHAPKTDINVGNHTKIIREQSNDKLASHIKEDEVKQLAKTKKEDGGNDKPQVVKTVMHTLAGNNDTESKHKIPPTLNATFVQPPIKPNLHSLNSLSIKATNVSKVGKKSSPTDLIKHVTKLMKKTTGFLNESEAGEEKFEPHKSILGFKTEKWDENELEVERNAKGTLLDKNFSIPRRKENAEYVDDESTKNADPKKSNKYVMKLQKYKHEKELKEKKNQTNFIVNKNLNVKNKTVLIRNHMQTKLFLPQLVKNNRTQNKENDSGKITTNQAVELSTDLTEKKKSVSDGEKRISTPDDFLLDDKGNVSAKLSTKERDELRELFNFTSMNKTNTNKSETKLAGTVLSGMQDSNETNKTFEETETEEEKDFVENAIENNIGNQTLLKEELKDLDKDFGFEGSSSDDEGSALNSEEGSGNSIKEIKIKDSNHLKTNKTKVIQKADEASMLQKIKASGKGKPKTASGEVILHPTTQRHVTNPNAKKDPFKTESVNDIYLYRNKSHNPAEEGLNVNKTNKAKNNQQKQQQQAFVNSFSDSFQEILKQAERKVERDNAAEGSEGKLKVKKQKADEKLEDEDVFGNKKISADEQREVRKKSNRNQTKPVIKDAPKPLTYNSSKIDISNAKPAKEERNASSTMLGSKNTTAKSRKQLAKKLTGEILTHLSKVPQESAKQVIQLKVTKKPNATGKNKKVAEDKKLTSEDSSLKENEKQNTVERKKLKKKKENAKLKKEKSSAALSESALENKIKSTAVFNDSVLQSEYKENSNNDSFTNVQAASVESSKIQYGANKTTSMFQSNQSFNETLQSNANTTNKTTSNQLTNAVRNVTSKTQPNSMTDNTVQYNGMTASDAEKVNRITPNDALNADLNTPSQYSKESSLSDTALLNKSSQYQSFTDDKAGDGLKYGQNSKVDKKEKGMTYGNQELGKTIFATDIPEARTSEDETPTGSTKVSKMEFYKTGSSISKMNSKQKLQTNNLTVKSNTTKLAKGQHQNKTKVHNVARQPLNDDAENIDSSSLEELDNFEDMDSFSGFAENDTNALNNEFSNEDSKALHDYLLSSNKGPLKIKGLPQQTLNALANDLKETASMTNEVSFKKLPSVKNATLNSARHRNTTVRKENTKSEKPTLNATLTMLKSKDSELIKETTKDTQQSSSGDGSDFLDHSSDEQYKTHNTAFGESTKVNDATSMDSTSPRKETGAIKGEKEVLSSLNNNLDAAQSSLNTGKNVNPSTINYHNKNKTQTLKPKLDFENEDQDQADKVKVLIKQTNPREKPLKELTQWLSDVIKTSSSRGENMNKTTFLVNNVANRSNLVNDYKRINKTQSVAKPAKKPIESDEHVKEVLVNAAHEGKDAQSNSYGKKPNEESIEVNKMKEQRLTSVNEMHHTKIADDIKGDKQIAGGDTINGLAKAMAEIMSSNPDNGNSMEDLENIDSTAKNILSEVDEDSKGDDLTDEDNSNATDEASKGKFSPNMTTHNSTQAHLKDKTSAKGIPSTAESYFVSQNVDEDDEEGDNSKSSNADPKAAAAPLKVSPKTKLKLKVPLSYTRPSLGNVKATEQETVKGQNVEVHVNGKAGSTVAAFAKEKNAESEGELIHEFKQLFNIGDSGETKKAPKVSKVNHIDSSKPTANVWDKIKQKAVAGARQIGAKKVHEHRIVTVKDEAEKERMVNGLVADIDRCVSLKFTNELGNRYKLVSSINNHGYTPRGKIFTLKQVFKDPRAHRYVSFHASDELDEDRAVLLNGARELVAVPVSCKFKPRVIKVTSRKQAKRANLFKKDNVSPLAMRNIGYMGFEQENEQGFCSSRCTEYCATSCPSYCCSAPIPGGERAPGETSDENTPREEDNAAQNEPSSRDDLPSAADNDDKDDTRADDIDDDRDDDANDDRADDNSEDRNDERNDSREESDQLLPNSRQAVQQDDSDQSSPW